MNPSPTTSSPFETHAINFSTQIQGLYKQVGNTIFPRRKNWLDWLNEPPPNTPRWRQHLLKLTSNASINYIWFFISILALFIFDSAINNLPSLLGWSLLFFYFLLVVWLCSLSYGRFVIFFDHPSPRTKRFYSQTLLTITGITMGVGFNMLLNTTNSSLKVSLIWLVNFACLAVPTVIFAFLFLVYLLIRVAILLSHVSRYFDSSFQPTTQKLFFPSSSEEDQGASFHAPVLSRQWLLDLTRDQLELIETITVLNLNNAEKRLIPTGIVFGVAGVMVDAFSNTTAFSALETSLVKKFSDLTSFADITNIWSVLFGLGLFLGFIAEFAHVIAALLERMTICSVVLDACAWIKYERQSRSPEQSEPVPMLLLQPQKPTFRQWLTRKLPFNLSLRRDNHARSQSHSPSPSERGLG